MSPEIPKPEWFQMAEEDGFKPQPRKRRALRIMAMITPLLALGAGLVFAQSQESSTAIASPAAITSSTATTPSASAQTTSAITIKKPAITRPTGSAEEDGPVLSRNDD